MTDGDIQIFLSALTSYSLENFCGDRLEYSKAFIDDISRNIDNFKSALCKTEDLYSNRKLWDVLKSVCSDQGWSFKKFLKDVHDNYYDKNELYTFMKAKMNDTLPAGRFHDFLWLYLIPKAQQYIRVIRPEIKKLEEEADNAKFNLRMMKDKEEAFFQGEL